MMRLKEILLTEFLQESDPTIVSIVNSSPVFVFQDIYDPI